MYGQTILDALISRLAAPLTAPTWPGGAQRLTIIMLAVDVAENPTP